MLGRNSVDEGQDGFLHIFLVDGVAEADRFILEVSQRLGQGDARDTADVGQHVEGQGIRLRCYNKVYLNCVARYYDKLIPLIAPYQITKGGPVLMLQIENEYGSYGNDKEYLQALKDMMAGRGITIPFVTSDGPGRQIGRAHV